MRPPIHRDRCSAETPPLPVSGEVGLVGLVRLLAQQAARESMAAPELENGRPAPADPMKHSDDR
jgi:hypothetical protein